MAFAAAPLPPLPFGAATAQTFRDSRALGDALSRFVGGLEAVEAAGSASASPSRISGVVVGDMGIMACATKPGHAVIGGNDQLVFGFVQSGEASYAAKTGTFRDVREDRVFVADSCPRTVATDRETVLVVMAIDRQRLLRTAHTMAGGDAAALAALALDDHIHRLLVMMLAPERFASGAARASAARAHVGSSGPVHSRRGPPPRLPAGRSLRPPVSPRVR